MSKTNHIALLLNFFCIICMSTLGSVSVFAQKPDSSINSIGSRRINKTPQIKASVPTYRPKYGLGFIQYSDLISSTKTIPQNPVKPEKILTVLKVYPNPVDDQINLILRIDRESNLFVKVMDLLGNEVVTLSNERIQPGEQTKNYTIPNRLNTGIYFLKIVAGAETVVKRISVL
ncbi:MAG TPA: T9SS type A sorting domain-containing protein [Pedobacter sp.]|uniref:T9SS type A sorting domain-containing protein n=1 Tax=Pedobacter sp. TaxID=1411316 RepID=UPI002CFF53A6|nr:T9SS type A sorting domain-containing protein [Pedobacter sp.]HMI03403.1 T9SS type A sorting domain-containing protein [Pedobacter sp.]